METDKTYAELRQALNEPGCPLCYLALKAVRRYLDTLLYEFVNDPPLREELRRTRGYCNEHAWWLADGVGRALGVAIVYQDLVATLLEALDSAPNRGRPPQLAKRLRPEVQCPACACRQSAEDMFIQALLQHLGDEELQAALAGRSGLCLPHFTRAVELAQDAGSIQQLAAIQSRMLATLRQELGEFIRKNDYRFRDEPFGPEADSWTRAIAIVSGARGVR